MHQLKDGDRQGRSPKMTKLYVVYRKPTLNIKTQILKVNGWRKIYHANANQKKAGVAVLTSDRAAFRSRKVIKDKEGHYIVIKGSILQDDTRILKVYAPNNRVPKYVRQKLIKLQEEIDGSSITDGDFSTSLSEMDIFSRQIISQNKVELNNIINHLDIMDIYSLLDPTKVEYMFFSSSHGTFTIKHIEDNIGENLDDLGLGDDFLDTTPKARSMKEMLDKLEFIRIKRFCSAKVMSIE